MTKSKFLILLVIGLLISNGILFALFLNAPKPNHGPREYIIKKLNFNEEQIKKYDLLIKSHRENIRNNENLMTQDRKELYQMLNHESDSAKINEIIKKIGTQQMEMEKIHFNHFLEIKKLCKPEQIESYNELIEEFAGLFSPKKPKP